MALGRFSDLCVPIDVSPRAYDALNVFGSTGPTDLEQPLFGLRRRDTSQRPNLGIRYLPARKGLREQGQRTERASHPNVFACRTRCKSNAPREPSRARPEAIPPATTRVEVTNEVEETGGGGIEVSAQFGDLVAQSFKLELPLRSGMDGPGHHRRLPFRCSAPNLHLDFSRAWWLQERRSAIDSYFSHRPFESRVEAAMFRTGVLLARDQHLKPTYHRKLCQYPISDTFLARASTPSIEDVACVGVGARSDRRTTAPDEDVSTSGCPPTDALLSPR